MAFSRGMPEAETEPSPVDGDQGEAAQDDADQDEAAQEEREEDRVKKPAELLRIEGSLAAVRAEVAQLASLDDAGLRSRLAELERRWRTELGTMLPESVLGELHEFFDWADDPVAGASELRIGLAQLAGWLDGLISGLEVPTIESDE